MIPVNLQWNALEVATVAAKINTVTPHSLAVYSRIYIPSYTSVCIYKNILETVIIPECHKYVALQDFFHIKLSFFTIIEFKKQRKIRSS